MDQRRWAFSEAQLALFPELRYFVEGEVPIEVARAYVEAQGRWPTIATMAIAVLLTPAVVLVLHRGIGLGMVWTIVIALVLNLAVSWVLLGLVFPVTRRRRIRSALREQLLASGIRSCPACAYDMRGLDDRCPECGARGDASG